MTDGEVVDLRLDRIGRQALLVGGIAAVLSAVGALLDVDQFLHSYLIAFMLWLGIAVGSTALLMLYHLTGGGWGLVIRRVLECNTRTIPLMALLVIPLLLGVSRLYSWAHHGPAHGHVPGAGGVYLNVPFFIARAVGYFVIWFALGYFLNRWSLQQDRGDGPKVAKRLRVLSGPGIVLYGLTVTFAAIDWVMSLEPHWFSTVFGMLLIVGQVLTTLAFVMIVLSVFRDRKPIADIITKSRVHDLGNLMLAFVMLWAYLAFSQFLIIWSGNLPEEISWYRNRLEKGWVWIAIFLLVFHFAIPFVLLLSRHVKRRIRILATVAAGLLVMRWVDLVWLVEPSRGGGFRVHWLDLVLPVAIGGIWLALFARLLKSRPLVPLNDPQLLEARHA